MAADDAVLERKQEKRIAVVFIHGQGQQRPMEDVQEMARTVWDAHRGGRTFTVPDARLGMADLGRVTTEAGRHGVRVDFFELYWAHLMSGNRLGHFLSWFSQLQARPRREAPHGLLPVRQWVIRTLESITLLCLLLAYAVALLLPPLPDGLEPDQVSEAVFGIVDWLPTPADLVPMAMVTGAIAILFAWIVIIANEIVGGSSRRRASYTLLGLKARAFATVSQVWPLLGLGMVGTILLVHIFIWQGPWLQWADARLMLLVGVTASAFMLAMRKHFALAAGLAVVTATLAIACALFGGIDERHLWSFGPNVGKASQWLIDAFGHEPGQTDPSLALAFYTIFTFAGAWFTLGLHSAIGAAKRWYWRLFWTALTVAVSIAAAAWMVALYERQLLLWAVYAAGVTLTAVTVFGGILLGLASRAFLVPVMTDSARYFSRDPEHIDARQKIREAGVKLLDKLHDPKAKYERVIIVAHSLGSAVGYELLMDYWARQSGSYVFREDDPVGAAMRDVEVAARALRAAETPEQENDARQAYRAEQRRLSRTLRHMTLSDTNFGFESGKTWLITDFVTLGSPLTHASLLLAEGREALWQKQAARTLATCPPTLYDENGALDFARGTASFAGWDGRRRPIHSAVFAPVRWTNHYFKAGSWVVLGDPIGGRIAPPAPKRREKIKPGQCGDLGPGVLDVEVDRLGTGKLFAHNEYWRSDLDTELLRTHLSEERPKPQHIVALIRALDLSDTGDDDAPSGASVGVATPA